MRYSQCSTADFMHPQYAPVVALWGGKVQLHRKQWEWVYIYHKAVSSGAIGPGKRALAFGVGSEPLPAMFAELGSSVTATDAPLEVNGEAWAGGNQFATSLASLPRLRLGEDQFVSQVSFMPCDMNNIDPVLRHFDFCWSSCCLEHLGTIDHGLDFIENSLETLVPGGVACHTTEFNCSSNIDTVEAGETVLYRRKDLEGLVERLRAKGHDVEPIRIAPDRFVQDGFVDVPPYRHDPHVKLEIAGYAATSIAITVRKGR